MTPASDNKELIAYNLLSKVYDLIQDEEEEVLWLDALDELCSGAKHSFKKKSLSIVDLGAGTGIFTLPLVKSGHHVVAVDNSEGMLNALKEKLDAKTEALVRLELQNLEQFKVEKEGSFDIALCLLDTLNHLNPQSMESFFNGVAQSLRPGGFFLFDFLSMDYIQEFLDGGCYGEEWKDKAFFWTNEYIEKKKVVEHQFSLYEREGDLYRKSTAVLEEYYASPEKVDFYLEQAGFEILSKDELGPSNRHTRLCRKIA